MQMGGQGGKCPNGKSLSYFLSVMGSIEGF